MVQSPYTTVDDIYYRCTSYTHSRARYAKRLNFYVKHKLISLNMDLKRLASQDCEAKLLPRGAVHAVNRAIIHKNHRELMEWLYPWP
jgi:hypothetical protein